MLRSHGLEDTVEVDSAGTHNYHPGSAPDARSLSHAQKRGYQFDDLRARQITQEDFATQDLILVMDDDNLSDLHRVCPREHGHKVKHLTAFCRTLKSSDIPDPYYGGTQGFEQVLDLVEDACNGLLDHVQDALALRVSRPNQSTP